MSAALAFQAQVAPAPALAQITTAGTNAAQALAAAVTFTPSLTPGGASALPWNYSTSEHIKIYMAAIKGLDPKFNGKPEHLRTFMANVERRAREFGWMPIVSINNKNLFDEYGTISTGDLTVEAEAYSIGGVTRKGQDAQAMYEFIMNSIEPDLISKLITYQSSYKVAGNFNGPLVLKTIISIVQVATRGNATPHYLETQVTLLPTKIKEYDSIVDFNSHVRTTLQVLQNYGRPYDRILPILFQAYRNVDDDDFLHYIKNLESSYDHGIVGCVTTGEQLMVAAEEQYKLQILRASWKVPTRTQAQIIALQAKLDKSKNKTKPDGDGKEKDKPKDREKQNAWKKVPPKPGKPATIKKGKATYHWCPHHEAWVIHTADTCRLNAKNKDKKDGEQDKKVATAGEKDKGDGSKKDRDKEKSKRTKISFRAKLAELIAADSEEDDE
jgi:hypothetical protein